MFLSKIKNIGDISLDELLGENLFGAS